MKKLFTLLTLLLCVASSAWADVNTELINGITLPSVPTTTYDLSTGNLIWSGSGDNAIYLIKKDADGNGIFQASAAFYGNTSATRTWANAADGNNDGTSSTTGTTWTAPTGSMFLGSSGYTTSGNDTYVNFARRGNLRNTRTFAYRFTGAAGISALVKSNGNNDAGAALLAVYKYDATNNTLTAVSTGKSIAKAVDIITVDGLTATNTYVAFIYGANGSNGELYEVAFLAPSTATEYIVSVDVDDTTHGSATASASKVKEGKSVVLTATANVGWEFAGWSNGTTIVSTDNPYTIESVKTNISLTATFTSVPTHTLSITAGETGALGNFYDNTVFTQNEGSKVTLPIKNSYFYKEGYTATGWTDGTNDYSFGDEITLDKDYAIYPKFELNGAALGDEVTTVTWDLSRSVADKMHIELTTGYVVTTAQVGTATIDVPSYWDNTSGKLDNRSRTDDKSQVNAGSKFTIPALKGMTVTLTASNKISATLAGEDMTATTDSPYTATYTYEGDDNTVEIVIKDGKYFSTIVVEYPFTGIPGPADPTPVAGKTVTWDFSSETAQAAAGTITPNYSNTLTATDGSSIITYVAGDNDKYETSYLKPGGKSGTNSGIYTNRYFILNITKSGTISFVGANTSTKSGNYVILQGSSDDVADAVEKGTVANTASDCSYSVNVQDGNHVFVAFSSQIYTASVSWAENSDDIELTTTSTMQGWRTFYDADNSYTVDENTKVYVATEENEGNVSLKEYAAGVPAATPVILKTNASAENDGTFKMTLTKTTETITPTYTGESLLKVTPFEGNWYRLGSKNGEVGFFPFNATGAAAGIVVLNIDSSNAGARGLTFSFADDETTAIQNVNGNDNVNKNVYDLQGRRVAKPTKGMYIVNGKKVIIK